jgi:hypothetical protein
MLKAESSRLKANRAEGSKQINLKGKETNKLKSPRPRGERKWKMKFAFEFLMFGISLSQQKQ